MALTPLTTLAAGLPSAAETAVSDLKAEYRNGQVFLTWREADIAGGQAAPGGSFTVYVSAAPAAISTENLRAATKVGHHIEPHSARDWWQDPASFDSAAAPGKRVGFVIESGRPRGQSPAQPLDPAGGLFVYTVPRTDRAAPAQKRPRQRNPTARMRPWQRV